MNENVRPSLAILRTQLPYVDRRSLSEAWFSALHLVARDGPEHAPQRSYATAAGSSGGGRGDARAAAGLRATAGPVPTLAARRYANALAPARAATDAATFERTHVKPEPSVRRAVVRPQSYPARHTSLTLGVAGARVQLVLRREGNVLHVIALCRPGVAALVSDALARADAHLRRSGDTVRASVRTFDHGVEV